MSRRSRIRWTKSDEKELRRLVKNYNAKVNRVIKKDPANKDLFPERVKVSDLKAKIETRSDLKREMNSLKRFLKRGSEEIVYNNLDGADRFGITKYEKREIEIKVATINRLKAQMRKEIEEMEVKSRGKGVGYKNKEVGRMERLQLLQPKVFNFKTKKKRDYEHFKKGLEDADVYIKKKDIILRDNYIDSLYEHLGTNQYVEMIADKINSMPIDSFISKYYSDKEAVIEFIYDPLQASFKLETLINDVWEVSKEEIKIDELDDGDLLNSTFSRTYGVLDKNGRVIKKFGTQRHAQRYIENNYDAVEYKIIK